MEQFKRHRQGSWSRLAKDQRGKGQMLFTVREGGQQLQAIRWGKRPRLKGLAHPSGHSNSSSTYKPGQERLRAGTSRLGRQSWDSHAGPTLG